MGCSKVEETETKLEKEKRSHENTKNAKNSAIEALMEK